MLRKALTLALSLAVGLMLAELGFRALVHSGAVDYPAPPERGLIHRYSAIDGLVYELRPSAAAYRGRVRTNRHGMRDHEYDLAKPPGVTRICVLGDSVAFGFGSRPIAQGRTFPDLLEQQLNESATGRFEVLNFAVVGYNAEQEAIVLEQKVLAFDPDVVLLAYVPNDDTYTDGFGALARETSPQALGSRLRSKLVSYLLHRRERRRFPQLSDPQRVWSLFDRLEQLGRREDFDVVVLVTAYAQELGRRDPKHDAVVGQARARGFQVVDLKESWKSLSPCEARPLYDGTFEHFSQAGMQAVAEELQRALREAGAAAPSAPSG
ncbi:MAG: SGNH/GDSL hydrolase family protein [Deltaproteobacteria bacterium]|nr:SGNH/GDSL hydrolase family protein [Deltaproteobacteria bacterium]MBW2416958.1 SGNH/GDSL hydrolase family protein [Deltaproteobacteria bacterium]